MDIKESASKLRFHTSTLEDWKSIFPDTESLESFFQLTKNETFPGSCGQSPYDDAFSLAYAMRNGISETQISFYSREIQKNDWQGYANKMRLLQYYGMELPEPIESALNENQNT
jgi:hypothetical protein